MVGLPLCISLRSCRQYINMNKSTYRRLNQISKPTASKSRWVLYILFTALVFVFFVLAIYACKGQSKDETTSRWLVAKCGGAILFRFLFAIEFVEYHFAFTALQKRLILKNKRFDPRMRVLFVPRLEYGTLFAGIFETTCAFGLVAVLTQSTLDQGCDFTSFAALVSIGITFSRCMACIFRSCMECRRRPAV